MAKTNQYQPRLAIPPGETLAEMLENIKLEERVGV